MIESRKLKIADEKDIFKNFYNRRGGPLWKSLIWM